MKRLLIATTALTLLVAPLSEAFAQGRNDNRHDNGRTNTTMMNRDNDRHDNDRWDNNARHDNGQHRGWHKGGRIDRSDWNRGQRVNDYRRYHLQRPPRGYEWRRVDNNYVLAAAATGLIMSLMLANQ
ncbi:MAG: RcnB family protein [Rhizomicrobium sp.]